jgi:hypothetical protein
LDSAAEQDFDGAKGGGMIRLASSMALYARQFAGGRLCDSQQRLVLRDLEKTLLCSSCCQLDLRRLKRTDFVNFVADSTIEMSVRYSQVVPTVNRTALAQWNPSTGC